MKAYFNIIKKQLLNLDKKWLEDEYYLAYPLFVSLKLINGVSFNMVNDTFIFDTENNQPTETINNYILTNYYLINNKNEFYENCVQYDIQFAVINQYNRVCSNIYNHLNDKYLYLFTTT